MLYDKSPTVVIAVQRRSLPMSPRSTVIIKLYENSNVIIKLYENSNV